MKRPMENTGCMWPLCRFSPSDMFLIEQLSAGANTNADLFTALKASGVPIGRGGYPRAVQQLLRWLRKERWLEEDEGVYRWVDEVPARLETARANLRAIREKRGWTVIEAAKELGWGVPRLRALEAEAVEMSLREVRDVACVFHVAVWELCPGRTASRGACSWPGRL